MLSRKYGQNRINIVNITNLTLTKPGIIEKLCIKLKIKFEGFHYIAVSLMTTSTVDEQLENLRFEILEKEHRWLSYKELASRMDIPNSIITP
jgi:hypothetical protein